MPKLKWTCENTHPLADALLDMIEKGEHNLPLTNDFESQMMTCISQELAFRTITEMLKDGLKAKINTISDEVLAAGWIVMLTPNQLDILTELLCNAVFSGMALSFAMSMVSVEELECRAQNATDSNID